MRNLAFHLISLIGQVKHGELQFQYAFKSFYVNNFNWRKVDGFQDVKMTVVGNKIVGIRANGAIYKFIIIGVGIYELPFVIYCYWLCMRRIKNSINYIFCQCTGIVTRQIS